MIVFIHIPGFYAAVEQADNPGIRGLPVIVGGDPEKRGSVTGASDEARREGVTEGMETSQALTRCPEAVLRPTRLKRYREVAAEVRALLRGTSDLLEELRLDGTFLQVPERDDAVKLAAELCVQLQAETGLRATAGIGSTRFVSYLGALHGGPGGIRQIGEDEALAFLGRFPVTEIWGLGPATAERLAEAGIKWIADIQTCSLEQLESLAGRNARSFRELARAEDREPLRPRPRARSHSQERTLTEPTIDLRSLGDELLGLARQLDAVLARERRVARSVTLGVGYMDGENVTRTQSLDHSIASHTEIGEVALQLLARTQAGARHVRRLRLQVARLDRPQPESDPRQLRLF